MSTARTTLTEMSDIAPILCIMPEEVYIKHDDYVREGQWADLPVNARVNLESIRELMQQAIEIIS